MSPQELLDLKEGGGTKAERYLDRYLTKAKDLTESTKRGTVTAVHSFYKHNYLDLAALSGYSKVRYVKVNPYVCPTQEELREILLDAHIRGRAIVNVISSGGFRVATASKLVWGDFKELWKWDGETPVYVRVESGRLKGEGYEGTVEQHTFMTAHACEVLLRYAEWYKKRRDLEDDSPLFITRRSNQHTGTFANLNKLGIWKAIKSLGPFKPHDLRRFAQTQLETARISPNWIKKMQGKKLKGEEGPYSLPKIEEMRKAFRDAESYLTLAPPAAQLNHVERRKQAMLDSAEMLYGDDKEKMLAFKNLMKKVTTEQELEDAKAKWWNSRI
jgi:integrase